METPLAGRTMLLTMLAQQLRTVLRCLQHGALHPHAPLTTCDGNRSDDFAGGCFLFPDSTPRFGA